ncbi:MAG: zeta toxin family protein [Rhodoglobus sp.]
MEVVRELSKPGQALTRNAPTATTKNPAWWSDGEPTEARDIVHERLLAGVRGGVPRVEQQRRAVVLAGPPGAGKSTVLNDLLGEDRGKYLVIDADEFKRSLLREAQTDGSYDQWIVPKEVQEREARGEKFYPLELAALVHEESSYLAKKLRDEAIRAGENIVIDTVLSNVADAQALGQRLNDAGYDVRVIDVEVSYELSEERIRSRWEHAYTTAHDGGDSLGGRWVPANTPGTYLTAPAAPQNQKQQPAHSPRNAQQSATTRYSARAPTKPTPPRQNTAPRTHPSKSTCHATHQEQHSPTHPRRRPHSSGTSSRSRHLPTHEITSTTTAAPKPPQSTRKPAALFMPEPPLRKCAPT